MESIETKISIAVDRVNAAIKQLDPIAVFGLFSGGHDSFSSSYVASLARRFDGILHVNTGIGIEASREYVRETCRGRSWNLLEYRAADNTNARGEPDPMIYEHLVMKFGFPGPASHVHMYNLLKERQLRRFERDIGADCRGKKKKRVLYVSGCRSQESERRMANTDEVQIDGRRIWSAPIHDFSKLNTTETLECAKQERSQVVDLTHKSGECLCGAFAKKGELEELNLWDITRPAYVQIKALEDVVVPITGRGWGERPICDNRTIISPGMLCWSCDKARSLEVVA